MKKTILPSIVFLLTLLGLAPAETRLVPNEYGTIQEAIDAAIDGDIVIVAPDTYTGDGNRDIDFKGKAITVQSTDPQDPAVVAATVIDCQGMEKEPHRGFKFNSSEGPDSKPGVYSAIDPALVCTAIAPLESCWTFLA